MLDLKEKNDLTTTISKEMEMRKKKQQMKAFDNKLTELADKIDNTVQKHGQDYFMVEILTMFLDVSIKMKEVMEMMESMNMVMELFGDAVTFIDESMNLQENIMQETATVKYTLFSRITRYFKTKAIIRNNVNRVNSMARNILTKYQMANDMVVALQGVSTKLKKMTQKISNKNQKKNSKNNGGSDMSQYESAQKFLSERREQKGGTSAGTSAPQGAPASSPKPSSSPSSSGGLDLSGV